MVTLLTGFTAFPGAPFNPTDDLVRDWRGAGGAQVATALLPVDWAASWPALQAAIEESRATRVVLFGVSAKARGIRIECLARNRRGEKPDAGGACAPGAVIAGAPETLPCRFARRALAKALGDAAVEFEWSEDAGSYLCNDTLFRLCRHAGELGVERFVFVHVPVSDERAGDWHLAGALAPDAVTVPRETIRRAALAVIRALESSEPPA